MILENNGAPLLCYFKLGVSFHSHWSIQTGVTVWKHSILVKIYDFFVPCDLEIWWMTLKNNRAPLLFYFKLCTRYHSHRSIQVGVTVQRRPNWVKISDFLSCVTLEFDGWHWKTIGHLFYDTSSFVHHFIATGELKLELQSRNYQIGAKFCFDLCDLDLWPLTFSMSITFSNGNTSWKFHDDPKTGTLWNRCHRWTDGQTDARSDRSVIRAAWSQLKTAT